MGTRGLFQLCWQYKTYFVQSDRLFRNIQFQQRKLYSYSIQQSDSGKILLWQDKGKQQQTKGQRQNSLLWKRPLWFGVLLETGRKIFQSVRKRQFRQFFLLQCRRVYASRIFLRGASKYLRKTLLCTVWRQLLRGLENYRLP